MAGLTRTKKKTLIRGTCKKLYFSCKEELDLNKQEKSRTVKIGSERAKTTKLAF